MSGKEYSDKIYDFINGMIEDLNDIDKVSEEALDFCEGALNHIQKYILELDKESEIYEN